jgi:hypothetical protein
MRGVSMVETALALCVLASIGLAAGGVMSSTSGLGRRSHADLVANEQNRRGLERASNILRSASGASLAGFNVAGVASTLTFQTVTGMTAGAVTLSAAATMQWQAGRACAGVASPGDIVVTVGGVSTRVAEHVAAGGFSVTQSGSSLLIHLVTYCPMSNGEVAYVSGDTLVSVRN